MGTGRPSARIAAAAILAAGVLSVAGSGGLAVAPAGACVGRTLFVGYYDAPEQILMAHILSVFIDERTGTTVKLSRFATRDEAFEAIKGDKVSLYVDYSGIVLGRYGGEPPGLDASKNLARVKEVLNRKYNVIWLEPFGYDRTFSAAGKGANEPGPAGLMLCKDALSKFPALPKLLAKLRGAIDNETMAGLLRETGKSDPKAVARRFLKSRKLI